MALGNFGLERYADALDYADRVIHRKPDWFLGHAFKVASLGRLDRPAAAERALRESRILLYRITAERIDALPFKLEADRSRLKEALERAGAFDISEP